MNSTQTIAGQIPWRVGVSVITEHPLPEYVEGKRVPHTQVSQGYVLAHGYDIRTARERAERVIRAVYEGPIHHVGFFNTEPWDAHEQMLEGLSGLTLRN